MGDLKKLSGGAITSTSDTASSLKQGEHYHYNRGALRIRGNEEANDMS